MPNDPTTGARDAPKGAMSPMPHPLDPFRDRLGHQPDVDFVELAKVSVATVKWYRKTHGIPPFLAKAPSKDPARPVDPGPARPMFREPPAALPRAEPGSRQPQPPPPPVSSSSPWPSPAPPFGRPSFAVSDPTVIVRRARVGMTRMTVLPPILPVSVTAPPESTPAPHA